MDEHEHVGTAELLVSRIYPLDGEAGLEGGGRTVVVLPGTYPIYRNHDAIYVLWSGQINARDWHRIGDGMFAMGGGDVGEGPTVTFPSKSWSTEQFAEIAADPELTGRVRYVLDVAP